jgi:hypothetical protein
MWQPRVSPGLESRSFLRDSGRCPFGHLHPDAVRINHAARDLASSLLHGHEIASSREACSLEKF